MHLDVAVDDLDIAVREAIDHGATVAEHQAQDHVRVLLDPEGHPFCLYLDLDLRAADDEHDGGDDEQRNI